MEEHRNANRQRSILEDALKERRRLVLGLHGREEVAGEVQGIDTYSVQFLPKGAEEPRSIHKLQVKYAYWPSQEKRVHRLRSTDEKLERKPMNPLERPQDRYPCSDKRLFRYVDRRIAVDATLLEGEQFTGEIGWFSRYEFQMTHKGEPVVSVFRHALYDLSEAHP
jgi:sRNA-binding regulator protein Hfq